MLSSHVGGSGFHFHVLSRTDRNGASTTWHCYSQATFCCLPFPLCFVMRSQCLQLWYMLMFPLSSEYALVDTGAEIHFATLFVEGNVAPPSPEQFLGPSDGNLITQAQGLPETSVI